MRKLVLGVLLIFSLFFSGNVFGEDNFTLLEKSSTNFLLNSMSYGNWKFTMSIDGLNWKKVIYINWKRYEDPKIFNAKFSPDKKSYSYTKEINDYNYALWDYKYNILIRDWRKIYIKWCNVKEYEYLNNEDLLVSCSDVGSSIINFIVRVDKYWIEHNIDEVEKLLEKYDEWYNYFTEIRDLSVWKNWEYAFYAKTYKDKDTFLVKNWEKIEWVSYFSFSPYWEWFSYSKKIWQDNYQIIKNWKKLWEPFYWNPYFRYSNYEDSLSIIPSYWVLYKDWKKYWKEYYKIVNYKYWPNWIYSVIVENECCWKYSMFINWNKIGWEYDLINKFWIEFSIDWMHTAFLAKKNWNYIIVKDWIEITEFVDGNTYFFFDKENNFYYIWREWDIKLEYWTRLSWRNNIIKNWKKITWSFDDVNSVVYNKSDNSIYFMWRKDWISWLYKTNNINKTNINNNKKTEWIKQVILLKNNLKNTKWNKYVLKFDEIIPKLTDEKLLSINKKLEKFDLNNSKYKNFKEILTYLKLKIELELYNRNINNDIFFKQEYYNECHKLDNLKTLYLYKNWEKIEIANEINWKINDVRQEWGKIYYTWDSQIDPWEKIYDIKNDVFIKWVNCSNCKRRENICK